MSGDAAGLHVQEIVEVYLSVYPDERERLAPLLQRLDTPEEIHARHRMDGHVTGSAFVVDPDRELVLLIHHRTLGQWFQPGGHVEPDETPAVGAEREAAEETGLQDMAHAAWCEGIQLPIDIDPHRIPANPRRGEDSHWHFDMRYLFVADSSAPLHLQEDEVADVRWVPLAELEAGDSGNAIAARKIRRWIDSQ